MNMVSLPPLRYGKKLVRDEDSVYYEYGFPATSEIAVKTDNGGIKNFPKGFNLQGANVVYEGFIQPECCGKCEGKQQLYQFILYYSGYVKVYIDGKEVVPERWRTCGKCEGKQQLYQFILYYSGYVKVYIDGKEVVPERWRTAWNPNAYKFATKLAKGKKAQLRIEWKPDGGEAYCGLRVAEPRSEEEREGSPLS